ncbi:MAG: DNA polymerase III subunit delta' [Dehalococcoidia bacterium]|nr:DNA polymerase III subunit delta' [Dehalococcoidia bacterium]
MNSTSTEQPGAKNAWGLRGHDTAVEALRRAIRSGHLAHAYLLGGPPGVGKTALGRRLAATLVSPSAEDTTVPDLDARAARQIEVGVSPDVERIAIGGICDESQHDHAGDRSTRIRICQVRRLERVASLAPFAASRRVFIIDTADDLQTEAAHAILKTLEEPPVSALFILVAADPDALLPTIRSRCQEFTLRPMAHHLLAVALQEDAGLSAADATALAHLAHGRYGLAMRMHADPTMAVLRESAEAEAMRLASASRNERFDVADRLGNAWYRERESVLATIDLWREWWRSALLAGVGVTNSGDGGARTNIAPQIATQIDCNAEDALRALRAVQTAREHLLANTSAQLALEVMMLDLPTLPPASVAGEMSDGPEGMEDRVAATAGG